MSPLERAAQALAERMADDFDATSAPFYREAVRAVVAAIREPSAAMVEAAGGFNKDRVAESYTAMLDALLRERTDGR